VKKIFSETKSDAVSFSPHFSFCAACGKTFKGLAASCPACGSVPVEGITRISGYFTHVSRLKQGQGCRVEGYPSRSPCVSEVCHISWRLCDPLQTGP